MKKIVVIGSFLALLSTQALADWAEDFTETYEKRGTEAAVVEALEAGVAPADIIIMIQEAGIVEPATVLKAFYCAELNSTTIISAANTAGLPESIVAVGYKQSVQQCGPAASLNPDPFSNTQNIAAKGSPVGERVGPPGTPPGSGLPPVILPPVDGGGGARPPSASPDRSN